MSDRTVVGDTAHLENAFYVDGTLTDPGTVTLVVTDPQGNTEGTYTYAGGTVSKSSTGVYYKDLAVDEDGVWEYVWTGTSPAADVESGSFTVWPVSVDDVDLLTLPEAKAAVGLNQTNAEQDDYLRTLVTAVSAQIDQLCGPVRTRTVTELHDGGASTIQLSRRPVYSITSVNGYTGTAAQVFAAESNTAKTGFDYLHDGSFGKVSSGRLIRRANNADGTWPAGRRNIAVVFVAGRAANTEVVPAKFKQAAAMLLRTAWVGEQASGSETFTDIGFDATTALLGPKLLNRVAAMLDGEMLDGVFVG